MESDKPFACDSCDKKYLRKNNLEDHVLMEHPDSEQVKQRFKRLLYASQFVTLF